MGVLITFPKDEVFAVEAHLDRRPTVYVDNDSLIEIARHHRQRFLDCLVRCGTLLFSMMNAVDLAGPQGDSADFVRALLDDVGVNWVP